MIMDFTMNLEKNEALVRLGGEGFHHDLHRLCSVVPRDDREFNGTHWRIKNVWMYSDAFREWWPEFTAWCEDFDKQGVLFNEA